MPGTGNYRNRPLVYVPRERSAGTAPLPARRGWWRTILSALRRTCTVLGAVVLALSVLGAFSTIGMLRAKAPALPGSFILSFALDGGLPERPHEASLANPFGEKTPSLFEVVEALARAEKDERVAGFVLRLDRAGLGIAQIQELRGAVRRFRDSGKPAWIYAPSYGGMGEGTGLGAYYLAAAFDSIWMQPLGTLSIAGIGLEVPYVRGLLDKIGVEPQFFQRKEYKTAFESFTRSAMSPQNREMATSMIENVGGQILAETAADRGIDPGRLRALIDRGLLLGKEARAAGLLDRVDYEDAMLDELRKNLAGGEAVDSDAEDLPLVELAHYFHAGGKGKKGRELALEPVAVALVYVTGAIVEGSGDSAASPLMLEDETAEATEISDAIGEAAEDEAVSAIVMRIDSPGGSPGASETIRRALVRAREKGKKIVVSMGDAAASGGYWIATPADAIFASPATITGSIGVVGGKISAAGLSGKIGVTWESVRWGRNSDLWSLSAPFSEDGAARINAMLDEVYDAFVARVAEGRKMTPQQVEKIAGGRVWTGEQGKAVGLVDTLGGLDAALDYTARQLGQPDRSGLDIRILPRPRTPIEELVEVLSGESAALGPSIFGTFLSGVLSETGEMAGAASAPRGFVVEPALLSASPR